MVPAKGRDHSKGVLFFTEYLWKILARASHLQREVPFLRTSDNCPDDLLKLTTFGPPAPLLVRWDGACNGQTDHCASVSTLRGRDCDFQSRLSGAAAASKLLVSASRRYSTFTMTSPQAQAKTDLELGISGATTTTQGDEHHHRERPTVRFARGAINLNFICLVTAKRKRLTRAALCNDDNTPGDIPLSSIVNDESTLISLSLALCSVSTATATLGIDLPNQNQTLPRPGSERREGVVVVCPSIHAVVRLSSVSLLVEEDRVA